MTATGVSERQIRRLELGDTFPQIKTVEKLASAHGLSVTDYLKELATASKRRFAGADICAEAVAIAEHRLAHTVSEGAERFAENVRVVDCA